MDETLDEQAAEVSCTVDWRSGRPIMRDASSYPAPEHGHHLAVHGLACRVYAAAHDIEVSDVDPTDGGFDEIAAILQGARDADNEALATELGVPDDTPDYRVEEAIADRLPRRAELVALAASWDENAAEERRAMGRPSVSVDEAVSGPYVADTWEEAASELRSAIGER